MGPRSSQAGVRLVAWFTSAARGCHTHLVWAIWRADPEMAHATALGTFGLPIQIHCQDEHASEKVFRRTPDATSLFGLTCAP